MPIPAPPQATGPHATDALVIDGVALDSRFFLGTAGYPSPATLCDAIRASSTQLLTVGLKRTLQAGDNGALAQALAVGVWVRVDEFPERLVAVRDQAVAPVFDLVQRLRLASAVGLVVLQRRADGGERLVVAPAHVLGEVLHLPLAGDLRGDLLRRQHQLAQLVVDRHAREVGVAALDQPLRQLQHRQRLSALLAAARAVFGFFLFQVRVVHRGPSVIPRARIRP